MLGAAGERMNDDYKVISHLKGVIGEPCGQTLGTLGLRQVMLTTDHLKYTDSPVCETKCQELELGHYGRPRVRGCGCPATAWKCLGPFVR